MADAEGNVFASYAYGPYGEDFVADRTVGENQVASGGGNGSSLTYQPDGGTTVIDGFTLSAEYHLKPGVTLPGTTPAVTYTANESPDWQPYKFSGKESLTRVGLELYDFGARMYSPSNMRWMTMDPLAEKYYSISPYVYCATNPINLIDPDGMDWYKLTDASGTVHIEWFSCMDNTYTDINGNTWNNIGDNLVNYDGDNAILYTQYVDEQGRLCLRSTTYNLADEESAKELESVLGGLVGSGASVVGVVGESMKGSRATFRLTNSKGKIDIHIYKKGWWGNQYVTPTAVSKLGKIVSRAGQIAGIADILVSLNSCGHATTPEEKAEHSLDMLMGAASFIPEVGPAISFCWTFGGKKIYWMWINEGLIPQIERGENPGAMINQPFK